MEHFTKKDFEKEISWKAKKKEDFSPSDNFQKKLTVERRKKNTCRRMSF